MSNHGHRRDPHLGGLVAAVADGALDHAARERALAHLARCDDCRAEVEAQRRLKARLARLAGPEVPPSLADRLLRLPGVAAGTSATPLTLHPAPPPLRMVAGFRDPRAGTPAADTTRPGDGNPFPDGRERPVAPDRTRPMGAVDRPRGRPVAVGRGRGRTTRRRRLGAAAGGLAAFALSIATVAALGSVDRPQPVVPAVDSYTVVHNRTAVGVPGADPVVLVVEPAGTR
ncbi:MAG TPA: zf-HC2 domain-containing protein [Mycobacteriales bacterium]|nr:zf-HC2 domain-containing protein [Mycobacteriales bacterium]